MPDLNEDEPTPLAGPLHLAETDDRLMWVLHVAGNEWGALGVALTAACMTDPDAVVRSLVVAGTARPFGPKAAARARRVGRAEVVDEGRRPDVQAFVDLDLRVNRGGVQYPERPLNDREVLDLPDTDPRRHPTSIEVPHPDLGPSLRHPVALRTYAPGLVTFDGRVLRIEYDGGGYDVTAGPDPREWVRVEEANRVLAEERAAHARAAADWESRSRAGRQQVDRLVEVADELRGQVAHLTDERDEARAEVVRLGERLEAEESLVADLDGLQPREESVPHPIAEDPRRPRLDHFPEDAILLTYREVRQLLGLHLEACATAVDSRDAARAMRDGETPLRLPEVLDR